jgi:hypothetical protein
MVPRSRATARRGCTTFRAGRMPSRPSTSTAGRSLVDGLRSQGPTSTSASSAATPISTSSRVVAGSLSRLITTATRETPPLTVSGPDSRRRRGSFRCSRRTSLSAYRYERGMSLDRRVSATRSLGNRRTPVAELIVRSNTQRPAPARLFADSRKCWPLLRGGHIASTFRGHGTDHIQASSNSSPRSPSRQRTPPKTIMSRPAAVTLPLVTS